jgi:hypothetical protein
MVPVRTGVKTLLGIGRADLAGCPLVLAHDIAKTACGHDTTLVTGQTGA